MKKKLFNLLLCLIGSLSCNAQVTLAQLKGTWERYYPVDKEVTDKLIFTENTLTSTIYWKLIKRTGSDTHKYYLSSSIPSTFNFSSVGKIKQGTYIIEYNDKCKEFEVYHVDRYTENYMTLRIKILEPVVGPNEDVIVKYKRIK